LYSIFACLASVSTRNHNDDDDGGGGFDAASCAVWYALTCPSFPRLAQYPNCYLVECPLPAMSEMDVYLTTLPALVVLVPQPTQWLEEDSLPRACDLPVGLGGQHPLGGQGGVDA
jgi:hypothetical protein